LALARIIVGEHVRRTGVPASVKPFTQFQPHARMTHQVADLSCLHAVLCHDPELIVDTPIAHRSAPRLSRLATQSFEKRISRRRNADSKQKFDRRIEEIFLQQMNNPMFHFLSPNCTNSRQLTCLAGKRYVLVSRQSCCRKSHGLPCCRKRKERGVLMAKDPTKKPPATAVSDPQELENQIRQRAYALYEARGREDGHDLEDWLLAEEEIMEKKRPIAA